MRKNGVIKNYENKYLIINMKTRSKGFVTGNEVAWENADPGITRKIMAYDGQIMMVRVHFSQGAVGTRHAHYHSQVSYVVNGKFEVSLGDDKQILTAGDSFYVEPDLDHGAICLEEGELIDVFSPHRADFLKK